MNLLTPILFLLPLVIPSGQAFLRPLQERDSVLVADQFEYGFLLEGVEPGTTFSLQDFSGASNDTLTLVRDWQIDTLKKSRKGLDIEGSIVVAPFEEGHYELPEIAILRRLGSGQVDTLLFEARELEVRTMPVDTATYVMHDIKGQMKYPLTLEEVLPWAALGWLAVVLAILAVCLVKMYRARGGGESSGPADSPYIVALRSLDKYRGDKYWAPDRQKAFYSGITDALKAYMEDRFGVDAPEMTTAELFCALKGEKGLDAGLYDEVRELFELADYVKFAKMFASDDQNAKALPLAVRFVTATYQTVLEEEQKENVL